MLRDLTPPIQSLILDMDGVLWKDNTILVDLPAVFNQIKNLGLRVVLATNNATRSVEMYLQRFEGLGVHLESWQVINSAIAAGYLLRKRFPQGGPVYVIGEKGVRDTISEFGFYHAEDHPLAVLVGMDRQINYEKLTKATLLIRSGLPFYATNPDKTFPTPQGLAPGAGAIIASVQAATDVEPVIAGKPQPTMLQVALERLETPAIQTLAVGDRLETDILGGVNAGCRTALVLSGVATLADLDHFSTKPDLVASDLAQILGILDRRESNI
jgi:4-nitrophenyl phosphatase